MCTTFFVFEKDYFKEIFWITKFWNLCHKYSALNLFAMYSPANKSWHSWENSNFYLSTVAHIVVVEWANKLAKVFEHVSRSKKYKNYFWKFCVEGCQLATTLSKVYVFSFNGCDALARCRMRNQIGGGFRACLARDKILKSFEKLGWEGLLQRRSQNTDVNKPQLWGHISPVSPHRELKLFFFLKEFELYSLKWVVGWHICDVTAESCIYTAESARTYQQDCK